MEKTKTIKRIAHRIRLFVALLFGIKHNKMSRLVDSTVYELRLMTFVSVSVIGFYFITESIMTENETEVFRLMLKFNCLVVLIILFLMIRILSRLRNKPNRRSSCDQAAYNWDVVKKDALPKIDNNCEHVNHCPHIKDICKYPRSEHTHEFE